MKAAVSTEYGPPDVIRIADVPKPAPGERDLLIRVHAAVVGPSDTAFRGADLFLIRLLYGLRRPKYAVQGTEFAGVVEAVGSAVTQFRPGDAVFGLSPDTFGAHAEYLVVPENKPVALKSPRLSFEDTVGIVDGAATALSFLRDVAKLKAGQRILINGASGAVGAYAVQLARYYGAEVTGVCSTANVELVESLGAHDVIDYTRTDFTQTGQTWDVIFDAVGTRSFGQCKRALAPRGIYMNTVPTPGLMRDLLWTRLRGGKRAGFTTAGLKQNRANLDFLRELAEAGQLRAVIDRCYPLAEIVQAHRYVETKRKKGNVVIMLAG